MIIISFILSVLVTFAGKTAVGMYSLMRQVKHTDYELWQDESESEFKEMKATCEPYEEFIDYYFQTSELKWLLKCIITAIQITMMSLLIAIANCILLPSLKVCPNQLGGSVTALIYDCVTCSLLQLWFALFVAFLVSFKNVWKWNILRNHIIAACFDIGYRVYLFKVGKYPCHNNHCYLLTLPWVLNIFISGWLVTRKYENTCSNRLKLLTIIVAQHVFAMILIFLTNQIIVPNFAGLKGKEQVILALVFMAPCFLIKSMCRVASQNIKHFVAPGKLYLLSVSFDIMMKCEYRILQAFIRDTNVYILMNLVNSLLAFMERGSMIVLNYFFIWLSQKCFKKTATHYVTPLTRRVLADMMLVGFQGEVIASVLPTTLLQFVLIIRKIPVSLDFGHQYSLMSHVKDYVKRVITAVTLDVFFTAVILYLLTKYMNLPLQRLWKETWKEKSLFALFTVSCGLIYVGYTIINIALRQLDESDGTRAVNCTVSKYVFW